MFNQTLIKRSLAAGPAIGAASFPTAAQARFELNPQPARADELDALSRAAVAELTRPLGVDPEALYSRTGGNPFFVTEVLAAGGEPLPETVRDAVLARAARLSERARGTRCSRRRGSRRRGSGASCGCRRRRRECVALGAAGS